MYKRFCINCGKETDKLIENLCEECYKKLKTKTLEKSITLYVCTICGKVKYKNKWYTISDFKEKIINEYKDYKISFEKNKISLEKNFQKIILNFIIHKTVCSQCIRFVNKKGFNYIIQLRGNEKKIEEIINLLLKRNYPILDIQKLKYGCDVYLNINRKFFKEILKILKSYSKKIKITRKLIKFDKLRSKPKYKVFISIRV